MDQFNVNGALAVRLLERMKGGEAERVPHATQEELRGFQPEASKCHENVNRWCAENPQSQAAERMDRHKHIVRQAFSCRSRGRRFVGHHAAT